MDSMLKAIDQYPNGTDIIVEPVTGDTIIGHIDTIYESDNELPEEDPGYEEYYSCVIQVSVACKYAWTISYTRRFNGNMQKRPDFTYYIKGRNRDLASRRKAVKISICVGG